MPMLAALGACATAEPPKTVSDVSCALFSPISFAQMAKTEIDAARSEARDVIDRGNSADTDQTVREIQAHNAKYDTVCSSPLTPPGHSDK